MMQKPKKIVRLKTQTEAENLIYIELADHPHELASGIVNKSIGIHGLISGYDGPKISIQFDRSGKAIGIEILYPHAEFYEDE